MDKFVDEFKDTLFDFKHSVFKKPHDNMFGGLTMTDMMVFWTMHSILKSEPDKECVAIGELVKRLKVSKSAITQNINKLENKELVKRITLKSNRRATYVCFTDAGVQLYTCGDNKVNNVMTEIVTRMGRNDAEEFMRLIKKFNTITKEITQEAEEQNKDEEAI